MSHFKLFSTVLLVLFVVSSCSKRSPLPDGRYKYVAQDGGLNVYDIERNHEFVRHISVPGLKFPRGIAANSEVDRLYIPHFGNRKVINKIRKLLGMKPRRVGYLVSIDLRTEKVVWMRSYDPSIDSLAISPDGKTLYMPSGEERHKKGFWFVLDSLTGEEIDRIDYEAGAHNTIVSRDGDRAYLASLQNEYLAVINTADNSISHKVGPFGERLRPFATNHDDSLVFVNVNFLSGFEVGNLQTGAVIHRVEVQGFPWKDPDLPFTQSHGIAMTPDEDEVWVLDAYNRHVHIFDVSGLPEIKPNQIASIDVADKNDMGNLPKWINSTRDGQFMHISTGMIIDANSRLPVANVTPSRYFIEIAHKNGQPVEAYSRYGLGYAD